MFIKNNKYKKHKKQTPNTNTYEQIINIKNLFKRLYNTIF